MQRGGADKGTGRAGTLACSLTRTRLCFHVLYMSCQKGLLRLEVFKVCRPAVMCLTSFDSRGAGLSILHISFK